jgi:hypothetical protein
MFLCDLADYTQVRWQAHLWFQADYGIFYAGEFPKQTQPSRNLNYWALWAGYKFRETIKMQR